jgi:hypothetical protein
MVSALSEKITLSRKRKTTHLKTKNCVQQLRCEAKQKKK